MWPQAQSARGLLTPFHRARTISGIFNIYIKYIRTNSRSHFNKSWQCPKNISIIKGATTKQKGQLNIGATGGGLGLPAHLAHLHKQTGQGAVDLCQQQAIKQPPTTPQNDLNTHNLGAQKWEALSYNVLQASISNKNSNFARSAQKCSLTVKATVPLNRYPVIGVG
uniref:RH55012p n=1 Tax=Drosophila melanogaster TaxID=7227 RepID=Q6IDH0_DROME|nr:RH55012p [Drosophila melanogaster]